jgi:hypothetical protein
MVKKGKNAEKVQNSVKPENNDDNISMEEKEAILIKGLGDHVESDIYKTSYMEGMFNRFKHVLSIKYTVIPNMNQGNTVVFKLYDLNTKKEINYAVLFCEQYNTASQLLIREHVGKFVISYYTVSPCLVSCDGEYRSSFNKYKVFSKYKLDYPELWNSIEEYVIIIIRRRQWSIYPRYFHSETIDDNYELERIIKTGNIMFEMLCLSWLTFVHNEYNHNNEAHMNESFKEIFMIHIKEDIEFLKTIMKKYGKENVDTFTSWIVNLNVGGFKNPLKLKMGIKMIPLNKREVQEPFKIKYKPWREFLINNRCADLIINQITPGVSLVSDLFLIQNTNKGLFDNRSQHERLKNSELATDIANLLRDAHRNTYFATNMLNTDINMENRKWINSKFKKLASKIIEPINYTEEEIIMSDVSIAYPSEHVGRTFSDILQNVSHENLDSIGHPIKNHDTFCKYMFEICYTLLCLNTHLGIIHGDLHLNNATIGELYPATKGHIVYRIKEYKYIFENKGIFACIIDFSRSLVNPEKYKLLINKGMPANYKLINDYNIFESNEGINLLNLYLQLFPAKVQKKQELLLLLKDHYDAVFKLLTCIDLYMFSYRLIALLSQNTKINKNSLALLEQIFKMSESFITEEMNHLASDSKYAQKILDDPFPMEQIIKKCFVNCLENKKHTYMLTDYYCIDNKLEHSLDLYETFPSYIKYKFIPNEVLDNKRKEIRMYYEKNKQQQLETVKFLAQKNLTDENL